MLPGYRQEVISNSGLEAGFVLGHIPKGPELGSQQHHSHFQLCSKGNCVGMNSQEGLSLQRGLLET